MWWTDIHWTGTQTLVQSILLQHLKFTIIGKSHIDMTPHPASWLCLHLKINMLSKSEFKFLMRGVCWSGGVWRSAPESIQNYNYSKTRLICCLLWWQHSTSQNVLVSTKEIMKRVHSVTHILLIYFRQWLNSNSPKWNMHYNNIRNESWVIRGSTLCAPVQMQCLCCLLCYFPSLIVTLPSVIITAPLLLVTFF